MSQGTVGRKGQSPCEEISKLLSGAVSDLADESRRGGGAVGI
jgi:hypothetical protein